MLKKVSFHVLYPFAVLLDWIYEFIRLVGYILLYTLYYIYKGIIVIANLLKKGYYKLPEKVRDVLIAIVGCFLFYIFLVALLLIGV